MMKKVLLLIVGLSVALATTAQIPSAAAKVSPSTATEQLASLYTKLSTTGEVAPAEIDKLEEIYATLTPSQRLPTSTVNMLFAVAEEVNVISRHPIVDSLLTLMARNGCDQQTHKHYARYRLLSFEVMTHGKAGKAIIPQLQELEALLEGEKDPLFLARLQLVKGAVYTYAGKDLEALLYCENAATQYEALGIPRQAAIAFSNMGLIYLGIGLNEKALEYMRKSLTLFQSLGYPSRIAKVSNDMAMAFKNSEIPDSALQYIQVALDYFTASQDDYRRAMTYSTLSNIHLELQEYDKALMYNDSSLAICERQAISYGVLLNQVNRADAYVEMGQYRRAVNLLDRALGHWGSDLPRDGKGQTYRTYARAYDALGDQRRAAQYYKMALEATDSLYDHRQQALMLSMDNTFQTFRAEKEITQLNEAVQAARLHRSIALFGVLLSLLAVVIVVISARARRQRNEFEVDLARRRLRELELEREVNQKEELYQDMKQQFVHKVSEELLADLKTLKFSLPQAERAPVEKVIRKVSAANLTEQVEDINQKLSHVNEAYEQRLLQLYPDLSPTELKVCHLIKLKLSTREMSKILNRSEKTISNYRSALRRKMDIDPSTNLATHLLNL